MSHKATNWAIQQRGLKPGCKIVLWFLCDRHNPDFGCFPNQDTLADDAEISRATLNRYLDTLEAEGMIRREVRVDKTTGRQMSTRYMLGFELDGAQDPSRKLRHGDEGAKQEHAESDQLDFLPDEPVDQPVDNLGKTTASVSQIEESPCLKNDGVRVSNRDTNLIKEPVKEEGARKREISSISLSKGFLSRLTEALGLPAHQKLPPWWLPSTAEQHVIGWIAKFGFSESRILEIAIASRAERPDPPDGPKALDRFMERASRGVGVKGKAPEALPPSKEEKLAWFAAQVNGDGWIAPSMISTSLANELVAAKLVTPERMKERGLN